MKKRIFSIFLAVLLVVSMAACGQEGGEEGGSQGAGGTEGETVKIGYTSYLSGTYAAYMGWSRAGVMMAVDEINEAGGINGKQVELIIKDLGGADTATAMGRLDEMKEEGAVAIMTTTTTNAAQWSSENKLPVILTNNISTEETIINYNPYTFFVGLNAWGVSKMIANETVGKQGYESFSYIGVDQACTVDAENLLIYEGQKINPDFHIIDSYRMNYDDDKYSTIVATVMAETQQPDFILQQGGGATFSGLVQQGNMYNMYDQYDIYTDLTVEASAVNSLVETDSYPYGHIHGISILQWWDTENQEIQDWVNRYREISEEVIGERLEPSDSALYCYLGMKSILMAVQACDDAGEDYTDPDVLAAALCETSFSDFQGEHTFRDFDHMLTYDAYYVTGVDGGEEFQNRPIGGETVKYSPEEWLPAYEDMVIYAEQLGYPDRFAD